MEKNGSLDPSLPNFRSNGKEAKNKCLDEMCIFLRGDNKYACIHQELTITSYHYFTKKFNINYLKSSSYSDWMDINVPISQWEKWSSERIRILATIIEHMPENWKNCFRYITLCANLYSLKCIFWSPNSQCLRMWLHLKVPQIG